MRRFLIFLVLLLLLPNASSSEESSSQIEWSIDLENGYITTKPLIVDQQVFVRTSGFWSGDDRPHVYAFDLTNGEENWRYKNPNSIHHDMSPLLFVPANSSSCGEWPDMVVVGWTDGSVTALNAEDGSLQWSAQTEVETWGVTGKMALDGELVVVPTRQGLSSFCLADGELELRVELPQLGWRNGVTVTDDAYLMGNEDGVLNTISRSGQISNLTIGDGMIRHAPIQTSAGILIHLQTSSGSSIHLDDQVLSNEGRSPAIPLQIGNDVFLGTSEHVIHLSCESTCTEQGRTEFHTNGEIMPYFSDGAIMVSFPRNTPDGGWGVGMPGDELSIIHSDIGTYTTAGIEQNEGDIAFGNDAGILHVVAYGTEQNESSNQGSILIVGLLLILGFYTILIILKGDRELSLKLGSLLLLIVLILALPEMSTSWSKQVEDLAPESEDWDDSWPESWKGTQVVVIELESGELAIGGLSGYENVEDLTDEAARQLEISVEKEDHNLGAWIIAFDGESGEGWEFTVDGERSMLGISETKVEDDAVVRWKPA